MTTYYDQVHAFVSPHLKHFRKDLEELDKASLADYSGEFIHGSRDSGTDLILFPATGLSPKQWEFYVVFMLRGQNSLFLHGKDGEVKQITRERVLALLRKHSLDMLYRHIKYQAPELNDANVTKYLRQNHEQYLRIINTAHTNHHRGARDIF